MKKYGLWIFSVFLFQFYTKTNKSFHFFYTSFRKYNFYLLFYPFIYRIFCFNKYLHWLFFNSYLENFVFSFLKKEIDYRLNGVASFYYNPKIVQFHLLFPPYLMILSFSCLNMLYFTFSIIICDIYWFQA